MKCIKLYGLVAILTCCVSGIMVSCSDDDIVSKREETAFQKQLRLLDWGNDTCYVYGHKTPDVDAVTSALAYAKLMRKMGYNCKAKVSSPTNRETAYIANIFGFALPEMKTSVPPQTRLILTDHTDYAQCVAGAKDAIVLQKIDHHVEGDIKDDGIPFVRREMVGSTNTIIYQMFREQNITIDDETARIMLAGIVSDTRNLSTSTTNGVDSTAFIALTNQLGITRDSVVHLNIGMEESTYDYSGMTDAETFITDYKDYQINDHLLGFGCLGCKNTEMDAFINRMLAAMPEVMSLKERQMLLAMIVNRVANTGEDRYDKPYINDGAYIIYYGEGIKEVAEALFGPSLREGVCYTPVLQSRKQIVPRIMELLQ